MGRWRRPHSETLAELQTWIPSRQWRAPLSLTSPPLDSGSGAGMTTTLHSETQTHPPVTAGGRRWVPVSTGTTGGGGRRTHKRREAAGDPTIVIPATAGIHRGGPAMGSRLHGNYGRRRQAHPQTTGDGGRSHNRHSRDGGNPRREPAMGSRLHGNYGGRRRAHPQRTGGGGRSHNRREAAGDPTIVIPATAGIHRGGRRWVPVSTGTTGGSGAPTNYGRRRRTHNRQGSGEAFVPSTLNSYDDYASLTVILAVDTITRSNCRFGSRASDSHVTSPF